MDFKAKNKKQVPKWKIIVYLSLPFLAVSLSVCGAFAKGGRGRGHSEIREGSEIREHNDVFGNIPFIGGIFSSTDPHLKIFTGNVIFEMENGNICRLYDEGLKYSRVARCAWKNFAETEIDLLLTPLHGRGKMTYVDGRLNGTIIEGDFKNSNWNGIVSGNIRLDENTIEIYYGTMSNGSYNGYGELNSLNEKYSGGFKNGEKDGFGILYYENGDNYKGEFSNGERFGAGIFTEKSGGKISGVWNGFVLVEPYTLSWLIFWIKKIIRMENGFFIGLISAFALQIVFGILLHIVESMRGSIVKSSRWLLGEKNKEETTEQVLRTYADGSKYVGEFKNDKKNGYGILTFADGGVYVGSFKEGLYNGLGAYTLVDGGEFVGEFTNGKRNGNGAFRFADGGSYFGEYNNDQGHGKGTRTYADGSTYVGEFKNDELDGQGIFTYSDGSTKKGRWKNGDYIGPEY